MSKLLGAQAIEDNPLQEIAELKQRMAEAEDGTVNAQYLADITPHAGQLTDLSILASTAFGGEDADIVAVTPDGTTIAELDFAHLDGVASGVALTGIAKTSAEDGIVGLIAYNDDRSAEVQLDIYSSGQLIYLNGGVIHAIHHGESENYLKVTGTSETSLAYTSIPAGALGATGRANLRFHFVVKNNKGSSGTYALTFYFGSKSIAFAAVTVNNSATTRSGEFIEFEVVNSAANVQLLHMRRTSWANTAADTQAAGDTRLVWSTAAIDTDAAATDFKVNVTLSANDANFFIESSGEFSGAYGTYS